MEPAALTFELAMSDYRTSREGGAPDAPNAAPALRGAESDATESVASAPAGGTAETPRDAIAGQARAVAPARSDGDAEPHPYLLILSYLQALDGRRDRAADTESSADNG